jgi:hypothetical protein
MGINNISKAIQYLGGVGATLGLTVAAVGCSGFQSPEMFTTAPLLSISEGNRIAMENTPSCIVGYSDFQIDEKLINFAITDKAGVSFGFNVNTNWVKSIGLNVKTQKGQMDMSMTLAQTADPQDVVSNVMGSASASDTAFDFNLDLILFKTDFSNVKNTPLTTLMGNTIRNGLANIQKSLAANPVEWSAPIVYLIDQQQEFIIPAGAIAGLRLGDQFNIYNINYSWAGDPCNSKLLMPVKTTTSPVALAQVVQLEENSALLKIYDQISNDPTEKLRLGSRVYIQSLPLKKGEKMRSLLHSLSLRNVASMPLSLSNGGNIDLAAYLSAETLAIMQSYGFYPRQ